jgi:hypothetical protein
MLETCRATELACNGSNISGPMLSGATTPGEVFSKNPDPAMIGHVLNSVGAQSRTTTNGMNSGWHLADHRWLT